MPIMYCVRGFRAKGRTLAPDAPQFSRAAEPLLTFGVSINRGAVKQAPGELHGSF